jgi:hypothetical protein
MQNVFRDDGRCDVKGSLLSSSEVGRELHALSSQLVIGQAKRGFTFSNSIAEENMY